MMHKDEIVMSMTICGGLGGTSISYAALVLWHIGGGGGKEKAGGQGRYLEYNGT